MDPCNWAFPPDDLRGRDYIFQGVIFKALRLARLMTQAEAAVEFGVSRRTICDWEASRYIPTVKHLEAICREFRCPYWCLVVEKPEPRPLTDSQLTRLWRQYQ